LQYGVQNPLRRKIAAQTHENAGRQTELKPDVLTFGKKPKLKDNAPNTLHPVPWRKPGPRNADRAQQKLL